LRRRKITIDALGFLNNEKYHRSYILISVSNLFKCSLSGFPNSGIIGTIQKNTKERLLSRVTKNLPGSSKIAEKDDKVYDKKVTYLRFFDVLIYNM